MNLKFAVSSTMCRKSQKNFARTSHFYMLVRSCCFSACRSIASAIKRSSSAAYGRPLASHIFEYMPIVVKPGTYSVGPHNVVQQTIWSVLVAMLPV